MDLDSKNQSFYFRKISFISEQKTGFLILKNFMNLGTKKQIFYVRKNILNLGTKKKNVSMFGKYQEYRKQKQDYIFFHLHFIDLSYHFNKQLKCQQYPFAIYRSRKTFKQSPNGFKSRKILLLLKSKKSGFRGILSQALNFRTNIVKKQSTFSCPE